MKPFGSQNNALQCIIALRDIYINLEQNQAVGLLHKKLSLPTMITE